MARKYDNDHRREQAELTKERILEVMVQHLARGGEDVSLAEVAEEAGVSLRSLHNHFPNQEARSSALAEYINRRVYRDELPGPSSGDDLPAFAERAMTHLFANEEMLRAQLAGGLAKTVRSKRQREIKTRTRRAVREAVSDEKYEKSVEALLFALIRAETGFFLKDEMGLSAAEVAEATRWATESLLRSARRKSVRHDRARRSPTS